MEINEIDFTQARELKDKLEALGFIAILWHAQDVKALRPDLTDDQCKEVLLECEDRHGTDLGITWQVIAVHAHDLFPLFEERAA